MAGYEEVRIRLTTTQLYKLKSTTKKKTRVILRITK